MPTTAAWQGWVWLAQFAVIIFNALLLFLLPHMHNLQNDGMESFLSGIKTPDDLVNELQILETSNDVTEDEKKVIKKIREKIK